MRFESNAAIRLYRVIYEMRRELGLKSKNLRFDRIPKNNLLNLYARLGEKMEADLGRQKIKLRK